MKLMIDIFPADIALVVWGFESVTVGPIVATSTTVVNTLVVLGVIGRVEVVIVLVIVVVMIVIFGILGVCTVDAVVVVLVWTGSTVDFDVLGDVCTVGAVCLLYTSDAADE